MSLKKKFLFKTVAGSSGPANTFNIKTYTGNRPSNVTVNTFGFNPDLVVIKDRDNADQWSVLDTTRGQKTMAWNSTDADSDFSGGFEFTSGGFIVKNTGQANTNGAKLVSYGWKAGGGSTSTDSNGTINSTVQNDNAAGFSISQFTNTSPGGSTTVGHGLKDADGNAATPDMIILKRNDGAEDWYYFHTAMGTSKFMRINQTAGIGTATNLFNTVNSTVFNPSFTGATGQECIAYSFRNVSGLRSLGSYTGDGNVGQAISCGFQPDYIFIKTTVGNDNWRLYDTARGFTSGGFIEPNRTDAEDTADAPQLAVSATGFSITSGGVTAGNNVNGNLYTYWAEKIVT